MSVASRLAVLDILPQRDGKQQALLADDADLPPNRFQPHLPQIHAVDQNASLIHVIEAGDQVDERGFARAGRPDNRDDLARRDVQTDVVQHGMIGIVAECDALELHRARHLPDSDGVWRVRDFGARIQRLEHALDRRARPLHLHVEVHDTHGGIVQLRDQSR